MAIEKKNVEATLESKKELISELETALANFKKERELASISSPTESGTDEKPQENSPSSTAAVYATEIEHFQKRINEMVIFLFYVLGIKKNIFYKIWFSIFL